MCSAIVYNTCLLHKRTNVPPVMFWVIEVAVPDAGLYTPCMFLVTRSILVSLSHREITQQKQ